ncbi:MAG: hypothetical protein KUG61_10700 [Parvibaculaceae bacterium]|nr:hypothetical protein [Parvibaculaceae bacterium]
MRPSIREVAEKLAELYEKPFGGKSEGRYRISAKMLRKIASRNKLPERYIQDLAEELFELGFVLLNMETFFALASVRTFASYRRLGEASLEDVEEYEKKVLQ